MLERFVIAASNPVVHTVWWRYPRRSEIKLSRFTASALYVFGSFARGASMCGDLDLILAVERDGTERADDRHVRLAVFGRTRNVDIQVQYSDDEVLETRRFPESRLVWSRSKPDWRANVAAIPLDAAAGRAPRIPGGPTKAVRNR